MICLECAICHNRFTANEIPAGWRRLYITDEGEFISTPDLQGRDFSPLLPFEPKEEIDVCGQLDALVAFERNLERGTFEPAPEAAGHKPVDAFAELT